MSAFRDLITDVTEEDIAWVSELMALRGLDEPRKQFLKSLETLDVAACPGSGKTTMVVAKLAILARKWTSKTRGICVLSHTNVAREEIEQRLGGTDEGRRLLSYPHFIGTIHGFVSRFLATPWLLSSGYRFTAIDDELTHRMRFNCMSPADRRWLRSYFVRCEFDAEKLRLEGADFNNPLQGVKFPSGPDTRSYKIAAAAMSETAKRGYFCYDEIFVLGEAQLARRPGVAVSLRHRFPCVLVDEMQDTSQRQNAYLSQIFPRDDLDICVMRVGDPNQAIFESDKQSTADGYPDTSKSVDISSSFRFDSSIASLADPFAFHPVAHGLRSLRFMGDEQPLPHTILVFPDGDCGSVLNAYGRLVLEHLPADLAGRAIVTAVGLTHQDIDPSNQDAAQYPKTVSHYWDKYERKASRTAYRPPTLIGRLRFARSLVTTQETAHQAVEEFARALIHLVNLLKPLQLLKAGSRQHVYVQQLLVDPCDLLLYQRLLAKTLFGSQPIDHQVWMTLTPFFTRLAVVLSGHDQQSEAGDEYLAWAEELHQVNQEVVAPTLPNIYRCHHAQKTINIKLSSIHAAKGQTHTATLVLETFSYDHFLDSLMPWILGAQQHGKKSLGVRQRKRLLAMYVAMTRPTHLLCLAISRRSLGEAEAFERNQKLLIGQGWQILHIPEGQQDIE